ncbi:XRE family transcriptional regulator [Photobacterium sanctipauli]|uniref:XRE family transcriptional regulator n=1 Tax=Photobacterium sanctipauli TaxID=1342794 RepID=A0A2T3NCF0_9GAMM|nr:helix-turn-helix transcriptional regulator [Photobacterium sanctipauli]PSW11703.1 XRE family transcriptional regulator [Photobacterium sanctipauli]
MEIAKSQIASKIREAREWKELSQVVMAKKLDIARQTYLDLESGKTEPRITTLLKIALLTGRPLEWFIGDIMVEQGQDNGSHYWQQLSNLYGKLPEPLQTEMLKSHLNQVQACIDYISAPK